MIFTIEEEKLFQQVDQEISTCQRCSIAQTCTHKVPGEGPVNAHIMSISEAPGKEEDISGRPYMGRAGKFWEGMLTCMGLSRDSLYVCNAICCRPPDNKLNNIDWIDSCNEYLWRRIALVQPQIILVFGKYAGYALNLITKTFLEKNKPYGKLIGPQQDMCYNAFNGEPRTAKIMWFYHPSYLMRPMERNQIHCAEAYDYYKLVKEWKDGLVTEQD